MSSSKRHFTAVIDSKEYGIYVSSTPSSAARKVVSKLCANNKNKKVRFSIRETTQKSRKKTYGPYTGFMQKLDKPVELEGRVIRYKPVVKLDKKCRKNEDFSFQSKIKQKGGMNCVNERVFKNILETCWMISIQTMMCFGDATKEQFERELAQPNTSIESIINLDEKLQKFLPSKYIELETRKRIEFLFILLNAFIKRYIAKIERHIPILDNPKKNPNRCELLIQESYFSLFQNLKIDESGGTIVDNYFFANLLSIFFLKQEIYFSMHTRKMFNQIRFNNQINIGIIIKINEHACCFFVCKGEPKFYNDNDKKIYDLDFMYLLRNLKDDEDLFVIPNQVVALKRNEYSKNIKKYFNYKKIQVLTVVSKNNFGNNFNQEINLFFNEEYDELKNFYLLFEIGKKLMSYDNDEEAFKFLKKESNSEFHATMFLLGTYYYRKHDINTAIDYYQKSFDNGYNRAAELLAELYDIKNKK
jgi:hypothetical protein